MCYIERKSEEVLEMGDSLIYRQPTSADLEAIEQLTREAFWNVYQPGCFEHYLIHQMQESDEVVWDLCEVCEQNGEIIGHIFYTYVQVIGEDQTVYSLLCFGPVSVDPRFQRSGIGSCLIRRSMQRAKEMGFLGIIITGDSRYYHRFGFKPAKDFQLFFEDETSDEFLLAVELQERGLAGVCGRVKFSNFFFDIDPIAVERFDKKFPPKEKLQLPGQLG